MTRPQLALVHNVEGVSAPVPFSQLLADHHAILQGYLDTHITRNHSDRTLESERCFLPGWFESFVRQDDTHHDGERQLFVREAMEPVLGRQRIVAFSRARRCRTQATHRPVIPGVFASPVSVHSYLPIHSRYPGSVDRRKVRLS